ncbi:type IV pilin N-terminal domain-containing protein [Halapricum hydrolyticum]|uniref:Type IV pilin N-terminal domain-containing protein n=1 Tax=Halapricum hydrolyticum TaxID=2979991 RepID=A0AAE3LJI3_9EURY|nr:type IV pilin N-terminal domain-containing protein [Halapricum hydrolyticum]MCU4719163.1 type IV pilin N-terminal domain-containing protein [Halapricum hydrolyticum]MCU4727353.1 type IV pilin N-terminal domain-containing protein [Halapricum hydrolyticum]
MKLKELITDDDAVSPVIGVILMVAITVILAAVIASFVLGLGDTTNTTPQASLNFDYTNASGDIDTLDITHESGDTLAVSQTSLTVNDAYGDDGGGYASVSYDTDLITSSNVGSDELTAGTTITLDDGGFSSLGSSNTLDLSQATVKVIWTDDSGDSSSTLGTWEGPEA